jgi:hypothetical protein
MKKPDTKRFLVIPRATWGLVRTTISGGRKLRLLYIGVFGIVLGCVSQNAKAQLLPFMSSATGKYGYVDYSGRLAITPKYDHAAPFSEGMAAVRWDDKCGYIDEHDGVTISLHFCGSLSGSLEPFRNGLAIIQTDATHWGYIDKSSTILPVVLPDQTFMEFIRDFREGMCAIRIDKKWGYIDSHGAFIVTPRFEDAGDFSEGLAAVQQGQRWGYIDTRGEFAVKPRFNNAQGFSEGLAAVAQGRRWGYIDMRGEFAVKPRFDYAQDFSEGLAGVVIGNKAGYIRRNGSVAIPLTFDDVGFFSEGIAAIKAKSGMMGYIDQEGKAITQVEFDYAERFSDGLALVSKGWDFGYVDRMGKFRILTRGGRLERFDNSIIRVEYNEVSGKRWSEGSSDNVENTRRFCYFDSKNGEKIFCWNNVQIFDLNKDSEGGGSNKPPSLLNVQFVSQPSGADVFMIPYLTYDLDKSIVSDESKLNVYRVIQGKTDISIKLFSQKYLAVFRLGDRTITREVPVYEDGPSVVNVTFP